MTAHPLPITDEPSDTEPTPDRRLAPADDSADDPVDDPADDPTDDPDDSQDQEATVAVDGILDVLSDEYACRILCALDDRPLSATELVAHCDMSRPTVYRRLDRLTEADIVDSQRSLSPEGHTRQEYHCTLSALTIHISEDGLDGAVRSTPTR